MIKTIIFIYFFTFPLIASSDIIVQLKFNKDTCEFGEQVHLKASLKWKGLPSDLQNIQLIMPALPWLKVDKTGTCMGILPGDSAYYDYDIYVRLFSSKLSQIERIKIQYQLHSDSYQSFEVYSPMIYVASNEYKHPIDFLKKNYFILVLTAVLLILLLISIFRYRGIKSDLIVQISKNGTINFQKYLLEMEKLFTKKKMNYYDSLVRLRMILVAFNENMILNEADKKNIKSLKKTGILLKKTDLHLKHHFTPFKEFENIYHETFQLINQYITENSYGGQNDNGHSKD